jgi:ubiquinone/menaquinone biosynthesis C-methylase UbiE
MRDKFAGGDPDYIRTRQYGTPDKLRARANLHLRYATAPLRWFEWMVAEIPWQEGRVVEVGCGSGTLWDEGRPPVAGPVVLTDVSTGMVSTARSTARAAGYTAEGGAAAAEGLPFPDRSCVHVISNHMLYHVPEPPEAVAEFARVLTDDGLASVATNGEGHMAELREIEHAVFGTRIAARTVDAFGIANGQAMLEAQFEEVELRRFPDALHVTDRDDALAYMTSYPPGEDATAAQLEALTARLEAAFTAGGGTLVVEKDVGLFLCRGPRRA